MGLGVYIWWLCVCYMTLHDYSSLVEGESRGISLLCLNIISLTAIFKLLPPSGVRLVWVVPLQPALPGGRMPAAPRAAPQGCTTAAGGRGGLQHRGAVGGACGGWVAGQRQGQLHAEACQVVWGKETAGILFIFIILNLFRCVILNYHVWFFTFSFNWQLFNYYFTLIHRFYKLFNSLLVIFLIIIIYIITCFAYFMIYF